MSQFQGGNQVRCIDCTKLSGNRCSAKDTKVKPKKRRTCGQYNFKGEYENRTPAEAMYMPHVDKKTRKMLKRLIEMGVLPVAEDGSVETQPGFARTKSLPMPASTATASLVGTKAEEDPLLYEPSSHEIADPKLIWTPNDDNSEEDNRG